MTDTTASSEADGATTATESAPYATFAALRQAHLDLRRSEAARHTDSAGTTQDIRAFIARARATGSVLAEANERKAAQGILDYWSAELASSPRATAGDFVPALLAPVDVERAARSANEAGPAEAKPDRGAREIIRLSAAARLWRDSNKEPGFLLYGDAIEQAARFRHVDPDIADLVEASEDARDNARYRRRRNLAVAGTALGVVGFCIAGLLFFQFMLLSNLRDLWLEKIRSPTSSDEVKSDTLWWLGKAQPWLPPYDFSGPQTQLANIDLPKYRLHAPNFVRADLDNVKFRDAELSNASFSESDISFAANSKGPTDFTGAKLRLAQFREANIASTSFVGADLYRATFDRALLCDVNFSEADLHLASFWSARFDRKTEEHLKKTAWWMAVGWNSAQIARLLNMNQSRLDQSKAFKEGIERSKSAIANSAARSFDRAAALNAMAWTLATWGINIGAPPAPADPAQPCKGDGTPTDALDAAGQAVCIAAALNQSGTEKGKYDLTLANFRDTRAYLLMQTGGVEAAANSYRTEITPILDQGEVLFRYAVAQNARGERDAALEILKTAIGPKQYRPSHELMHLKAYITGPFKELLDRSIDERWPATPAERACPSGERP